MKQLLFIFLFALPLSALAATQSIDLNGSSQYLSHGDNATLSLTGNQTHEGWLYFTGTPSSGNGYAIFDKYVGAAGARGISMVYENNAGTLRWHARTSADGNNVSEGTLNYAITTGEWHHYRFVYSTAGSIQIFVDEVSIGTIAGLTTSIRDNSAAYQLGFNSSISGHFPGRISLWRIWNTAHTTDDMCTTYGTAATNLVAEWSLDGVLTDASGNGLTLTNNGTASFVASTPSCVPATAPFMFWQFFDF
jgi:hypothetical protein